MNESRLMQQVVAVFSVFMVFFYLGVGVFFIWFSDISTIDKALRIILGSTFLFYGVYRAFRAWEKVRDAFFVKNEGDDRDKYDHKGHMRRFK